MTREQKHLNNFLHDVRVLLRSDPMLMKYVCQYYVSGLTTLDDCLTYAGRVGAAYRENGLGIDGKEKKHDTD